jgi:triosephosphate isomerase
MNKDVKESLEFLQAFKVKNIDYSKVDILIAPPFTSLYPLAEEISKYQIPIFISAQNIYMKDEGAYTGEISANMVKGIGATYTILGHSERREYFNETDRIINSKLKKALTVSLNIILCVGEQEFERDAGVAYEVVLSQLGRCLKDITFEDMQKVTIAYEPVWAIGTGKTASSEDAEAMHNAIRNKLSSLFNDHIAEATRILYGGSVKPDNIKDLMSKDDIDGALVGGASLDVEKFYKIATFYA